MTRKSHSSRRWANPDLSGGAVSSGRRAVEAATPAQRDEMRRALGMPVAAEIIPEPISSDPIEALCEIIRMMRGAKDVSPEIIDAWRNLVTARAYEVGLRAAVTLDYVEQRQQAECKRQAALRNLTDRETNLMERYGKIEE